MTTNTTTLPSLPALPKMKRAPKPAIHECGCGCGTMVARRFAPGHDGKLAAWVLRVERGIVDAAPEPHTAAVAAEIARRATEAA